MKQEINVKEGVRRSTRVASMVCAGLGFVVGLAGVTGDSGFGAVLVGVTLAVPAYFIPILISKAGLYIADGFGSGKQK